MDTLTNDSLRAESVSYTSCVPGAHSNSIPDAADMASFTILYEDHHLLAVAKSAGLVVHPAYKHPDGTLCDYIFARQAARGEPRPWLLHRLDRETSGLVLFAKTTEARRAIVRQFERHTIRKQYLAIIAGDLATDVGSIELPLRRDPDDRRRTIVAPDGQHALTYYHLLARNARDGYALVLVEPQTGRTHQIRAHFSASGAPLVGDARYLPEGHPAALGARVMLHAWRLRLIYPTLGTPFTIMAPLPDDMTALIAQLGLCEDIATLATLASFA